LDANWDAHKKFYLENLESYKTQGLLSDRPYLSRINDKYLKNITGELLEQDRLRGKLISTYFVDKEITTKQILSALEDNKRRQKEKRERFEYLLTNKGQNELNAKLRKNAENTVSLFKSIIKLDVTEKIKTDKFTDALGSFSYVDFFRICETARMESPILFDTRFRD
jgi:predicted RNA-binding protein with RPS1 domain